MGMSGCSTQRQQRTDTWTPAAERAEAAAKRAEDASAKVDNAAKRAEDAAAQVQSAARRAEDAAARVEAMTAGTLRK
jgi:hypothetical protein